ncbi:MAG: FAD-binding oxidoreductase [Vicinamibacterales bacterium]|nr:FAD-binding oxidoreductase [Vicinamibacterales bacterium]
MDRRTLLKTGGMAALGFGIAGCATRILRPTRPTLTLAPIRASWDRVIRTTVGLRPHRPSGFVLRAEKFDSKTVIHNYGHGGAGLSLSWGTGSLAADLALEAAQSNRRTAAVLGSGAVGLATARQLQRRGFDVTIYAKAIPPDTTSNMAWGGFTPTSGLVAGRSYTPAWEAQFRSAVEIAYRQFQLLVGPRYGITWLDNYSTMEELPTAEAEERREREGSRLMPASIRTGRQTLYPGEHPFPTRYASRRSSLRIEPSLYLEAMLREVRLFSGHIVIREFKTPRDLMTVSESVIVNCTGLGSHDLFRDEELIPVKGQLTFLVPQPEVDYQYGCMPRSDGIALGSTRQQGVWTLTPDEVARQRIVDRAIERYAWMRSPEPGQQLMRSAAPADAPSVESFFDDDS